MGGESIVMDMNRLLSQIKKRPDYDQIGMILCHNGVVRKTSSDGRPVSGLRITVDHRALKAVLEEQKNRPGIIEILVEIAENKRLKIGDDVMLLLVAGDIRSRVVPVLKDTLDAIKAEVTTKEEYYR